MSRLPSGEELPELSPFGAKTAVKVTDKEESNIAVSFTWKEVILLTEALSSSPTETLVGNVPREQYPCIKIEGDLSLSLSLTHAEYFVS